MRRAGEQRLIVISGPTGTGKTALGIVLAQRFNGEIVGADSRQVYRYMDIGTAKPTAEERAAVPHHLIDFIDPDQALSMAEYQRLAYGVISDIHRRGKIPLLVGGTGQYITAVLEGWSAPEVPPNLPLRAELEEFAVAQGPEALFARLKRLDPTAESFVDPRNVRRVIRAIEVCVTTGQPFSAQRGKVPPPYHTLQLGLTMDRELLYTRLDARIGRMMELGLLDEVRALHRRGYAWTLPSMSGLGYAELGAYLRGEIALESAILQFKHATHAFVRRQYTWFRKYSPPRWLDAALPDRPGEEALGLVDAWFYGA